MVHKSTALATGRATSDPSVLLRQALALPRPTREFTSLRRSDGPSTIAERFALCKGRPAILFASVALLAPQALEPLISGFSSAPACATALVRPTAEFARLSS